MPMLKLIGSRVVFLLIILMILIILMAILSIAYTNKTTKYYACLNLAFKMCKLHPHEAYYYDKKDECAVFYCKRCKGIKILADDNFKKIDAPVAVDNDVVVNITCPTCDYVNRYTVPIRSKSTNAEEKLC